MALDRLTQAQALLLFCVLAIILRIFSFFPTVIDHDESTYILIADALRKGMVYQVDYIDTKPIGIFLIIAFFQFFIGKSIFLFRLMTAIVIAATAFFLYKAQHKQGQSNHVALATGIIFLFVNSLYTFYGIAPNTETFFNLFTALALWLFIAEDRMPILFLAGLSLGIGFVVKYVVLFDAAAFGFFILLLALQKERTWGAALKQCVVMGLGFCIPFALLLLSYYQKDLLDAFWFHTFTVSGRYPKTRIVSDYFKFFFADFFPRFLPVSIFYFYVLFSKSISKHLRQFLALWGALVWLVILIPGNHYGHYCIQFLVPFSFTAGLFFGIEREGLPKWLQLITRAKFGFRFLGLLIIANLFIQKADYFDKPDYAKEIAEYLEPHLEKDDQIYMANIHQIVYFLLDKKCPIPYLHHSLFWEEKHVKAMEIDVQKELEKITSATPKFIVLERPLKDNRLEDYLMKYYNMERSTGKDGRVKIYKRKAFQQK